MDCIYLVTNIINGRQYIGQGNFNERVRYHRSFYKKLDKHSKLYVAMRNYGIDNFTFEKLIECEYSLDVLEEYFIYKYNTLYPNGYNTNLKFDTNQKGFKHTAESKNAISLAKMGNLNPMYGVKHSLDTKNKIRNGILSSSLCKDILMVQYSTNTILKQFHNRTEAEQFTGILKGTIWSRLHHGLVINDILWVYKSDYVTEGLTTIESPSYGGSE